MMKKNFIAVSAQVRHGNIFDFLIKTKSIGFWGSCKNFGKLRQVCNHTNFQNSTKKRSEDFKFTKSYFSLNTPNYFHKKLFDQENKEATEYLYKERIK